MSLATILAFDPATTPTQVPRAYIAQGAGASAAALAINALCDGLLVSRFPSHQQICDFGIVVPLLHCLGLAKTGYCPADPALPLSLRYV